MKTRNISRGRRWRRNEVDRLFALLRNHPRGIDWDKIAASIPGRTASSCKQAYAAHRAARSAALARLANADVPPVDASAAPPGAVHCAPGSRLLCLETLRVDAELRARIAAQGVTAGLLGDPPPGRSALDQRSQARP